MKHMIEREVFIGIQNARETLAKLNQQIEEFLTPPMQDISAMPEVAAYLDTIITEEGVNMRNKIKVVVLLFLFSPEYFIFDGYRKGRKCVAKELAKQMGISLSRLSHIRTSLIKRYKRYGKFTDLVDDAYAKVTEKYEITQK